ncbi:hypothetical protein L2D08_12915 [Domibacillus sp. PGB-M46]|uniref:hypothetical protein n=1 Tax=Domibacillus sp. PGB-M46 TaxID=2910255 RepID=UPI001F57D348|nr:hypothetical protein [Domibacillus sp. PGB-M46]MCI2255269.1 hypothetical protein [Domibacillus sp. PGB-M46]
MQFKYQINFNDQEVFLQELRRKFEEFHLESKNFSFEKKENKTWVFLMDVQFKEYAKELEKTTGIHKNVIPIMQELEDEGVVLAQKLLLN